MALTEFRPTRAMIMTGTDHHLAGHGNLIELTAQTARRSGSCTTSVKIRERLKTLQTTSGEGKELLGHWEIYVVDCGVVPLQPELGTYLIATEETHPSETA